MQLRPFKFFPSVYLWVGLFVFFLLSSPFFVQAASESSLSEEQKAERKLEFSEEVKDEIFLREKQRQAPAPIQKPWTIMIATNYGHDDNVTFDSRRIGDMFHQETVTATLDLPHTGLGSVIGQGKYGAVVNWDDFNYSKQNQSDYFNSKYNPYVSVNLTNTLSLKTEYKYKDIRYIDNDQITYAGQEFKASLTELQFAHWMHSLYASAEYRQYSDRYALAANNIKLPVKRQDIYDEVGYNATFFPTQKFVAGVGGLYKLNDSNDVFNKFNDYEGYRFTGFVYVVLNDRISWVGAAGYDYRKYDSKIFEETSNEAENDGFVYAASYVYVNLGPRTQFVFSYFFDQNYSNDPTLDFTGHILTAGFTVKI